MKAKDSGGAPRFPGRIKDILAAMGLSAECRSLPDKSGAGWKTYRFTRSDGRDTPYPTLLVEHNTKAVPDAKRQVSGLPHCVTLFRLKSGYSIFLKTGTNSMVFALGGADACEQAGTALSSTGLASAGTGVRMRRAIRNAIRNIPTTTKNFNNRGVFSTHYLKGRLLEGSDAGTGGLEGIWDGDAERSLGLLGWTGLEGSGGIYRTRAFPEAAVVVVDKGTDFGIQRNRDEAAPSYRAVAELARTPWVILTDGTTWRLYTSRVSASTTNYFEISLLSRRAVILRYLVAMFGAASYVKRAGKAGIDVVFDEGKNYVQELEENLAERFLRPDGVFVDLVKGVLGHDGTRRYGQDDLASAKKTALKIMYRIWFLLYAESRDLLPARDERYAPLSLATLRNSLDDMEGKPDEHGCWERLLGLFRGVRNGSPAHNLPQYNGGLFRKYPGIDGISIRNSHAARALRGFMERDGEPVDYASLGVRHLGHIYETLMEFEVRQADRDIMLVEDGKGVREVASHAESTYSYRKNDLYIVSRAGAISRKSSGSYYTPQEMVSFLVRRGLEPIFREREELMPADVDRYRKSPGVENGRACMDRLLDIQVLDPAMGSGHFLVEALNQITSWATGVLRKYPGHPLLAEIEKDRLTVISGQKRRGIAINEGLLTDDALLKRRVMKRCIFGVDINPLAAELARVSLWLDSFAIGVPLTYLNHHIRVGDSTIGGWRRDISGAKNHSLDGWMEATDRVGEIMERVSRSADLTVSQARASEDAHDEYERMMEPHRRLLDVHCAAQIDKEIIPKRARDDPAGYIRRFAGGKPKDPDLQQALARAQEIRKAHRFFHWELEMTDAFTDSRYGFDLIVGNPPWDTVKPYDDEFFPKYYPAFRSIGTKPKKIAKQDEILKDPGIRAEYDIFLLSFQDRSAFYRTYALQGVGDRDMWQLVLERMLGLVSRNGIVSVLVPSQILSNTGSSGMREKILDMDIRQMYVFENRRKIFPITSQYRFLLLTMRNAEGPDSFRVGFYLHDLRSLETEETEGGKFHTLSKEMVRSLSPDALRIPEVGGDLLAVLARMSGNCTLGTESEDGWNVALSRGFDRANDAGLLRDDRRGWPVLEGKYIHQFNHAFARPGFTASMSAGLQREKRKRVYGNESRKFYHSFRLAFRNIARSTDTRTIIAAIIPPQRFHTDAMRSVVLTRNGRLETGNHYNRQTAYLCGLLNSMPFDFVSRSKVQMNVAPVIKTISVPGMLHRDEIAELAAKLSVGTDEFEEFAESLRIDNVPLTPPERIRAAARLDALVAHAYGLTAGEYHTVLESFKFAENLDLLEAEHADFGDNKVLRQFYGEVRKLAPQYYGEIAGRAQ